jgi:hypothetical protein
MKEYVADNFNGNQTQKKNSSGAGSHHQHHYFFNPIQGRMKCPSTKQSQNDSKQWAFHVTI